MNKIFRTLADDMPLLGTGCALTGLGRALALWRRLNRLKQGHVAELLGLSQSGISRLEGGAEGVDPSGEVAVRRLMAARLTGAADRRLAAFVAESPAPMHLVCDYTHRLLALSPARARAATVTAADLLGRSLWPEATEDIMAAEQRLPNRGWYDGALEAVEGTTRAGGGALLAIAAGRFRWTRFRLSDGTAVRLVETLS